jgi:hypothetical protein
MTTERWVEIMVKAVLDARRDTYDPPHSTVKDRFRQFMKGEMPDEFSDKSTYTRIFNEAKTPSPLGEY